MEVFNISKAYCLKCKEKKEIVNEKLVSAENEKRPNLQRISGNCKDCGTKVSLLIGK